MVEERTAPTAANSTITLSELEKLMPQDAIDALHEVSRDVAVKAGESIITQGEQSEAVFFIKSGEFGIYRAKAAGEEPFRVAEVSPNEPVGEMAILDGLPRSATVKAETDGRVLEIQPDALRQQPNGELYLGSLRGALAGAVTRRLRQTNQEHVAALEREINLKHAQQQFGRFFIYSLVMMAIGMVVNDVIARTILDVNIYTALFAWQYLLVLLIPSILVIWRMKIPLESLGLTMVGLKRSLIEGAVIGTVLVLIVIGLAQILKANDALPGKPLPFEIIGGISYLLHSAFQELLARGFLQSSFQRFLGSVNATGAVLLAATFFGIFHLHFGLAAVIATIVSGCLFGAIYARHQNLAGVTLVHFMAGTAAFSVGLI